MNIKQYKIRGKKRYYDILMFPKYENAWARYNEEDDVYWIDAPCEYYKFVAIAIAIMVKDPDKIIYFPIMHKHNEKNFFSPLLSCDMVLVTPHLQFKFSEWFDLKSRIDKNHFAGIYTIDIDNDWFENEYNKLIKKYSWKRYDSWYITEKTDKITETQIGNTIFRSIGKNLCISIYHHIIDDINDAENGNIYICNENIMGSLLEDNYMQERVLNPNEWYHNNYIIFNEGLK